MTDKEHVINLLHRIPRNDYWQLFLKLIMYKNVMATLTPDVIVIKLLEKEATSKPGNGLGQEALLFPTGNRNRNAEGKGKGRNSLNGDESDKDLDRKGNQRLPIAITKGIRLGIAQA
jgi:hypothetical protein